MNRLSLEVRVEHIAGIIVDMLEQCPGMTWTDVKKINRTDGWAYTLPWYQAYLLTSRRESLTVETDTLDAINLRRAWSLAVAVQDASR